MHRSRFGLEFAAATCLALSMPADLAYAGGPLIVRGNGLPLLWSTAAEIQFRTDNGPLSVTVNEATARGRVLAMFNVWENVATASIGYNRAGFINSVGTTFTDGDVGGEATEQANLDEFNAVEGDCFDGNQSPIIFDADGAILIALGEDETSVIGFAGPCAANATNIIAGRAVINGLFQDGDGAGTPAVSDLSQSEYDGAFIHEFGHFSGLDHSQINVNCATFGCTDGSNDAFGLPTMFPFLLSDLGGGPTLDEAAGVAAVSTLATDDIAWISRLYPQTTGTTFAGTHGTLTGVVFFTDGQSHAQGVNVIARPVNTGGNQDRRNAVSVVSGFKFTANPGQSVTADYLPCSPASACPPNGFADDNSAGSPLGSLSPGDIGLFEIPVPAGNYTIEVETIDPGFTGESSVGPFSEPIPMPGTAPLPIGPTGVAAGATDSGNDITLLATEPRFDQFEGP